MTAKTKTRSPSTSDAEQSRKEVDIPLVRELALLLSETGVTEIEVAKGDLHIRVTRMERAFAPAAASQTYVVGPPPAGAAPIPPAASAAVKPDDHPGALKSPMVGTAYRRPSPEASPFVEIGSIVKTGDKVLLVEAMKTFNEILAHCDGVVKAIFIEDSQPVEYGQTLMIIE